MPVPAHQDAAEGKIERVLIVRPSALGDVARTVPALVSLRKALPAARIDWLVQEAFADAIRHHPALTNAVAFPRERFGRVGRDRAATREARAWARRLRDTRYDLVFDLQGLARSGLFTWLTRAPRRVGFANAREAGWLGCNRRHFVDERMHTVDRMLALLAAEGFPIERDLRLYVGEDDRRWLDAFAADALGDPAGGYFAVAPTARWRSKCWPIENYTRVTRELLASGVAGRNAVVLAAPSERPKVQPMLDALAGGGRGRVACPATSVGQMAAILSRARLLVCNDSAPLHIAVGFDRPIVAVFGPTDPARVGPYRRDGCVVRPPGAPAGDRSAGSRYRHEREDQSLIARVSVEAVMERIEQELHGDASAGPFDTGRTAAL